MSLLKKTKANLVRVGEQLKQTFTPAMKLAVAATSVALLDACQPVMPRPDGEKDFVFASKNLDKDINNKVELAINIFNQNMPANIAYAYPDTNGLIEVKDFEYGKFVIDVQKNKFYIENPHPASKKSLIVFEVPGASLRELFTLAGRVQQLKTKYVGKSHLDGDQFKLFEKNIFGNIAFKDGKRYKFGGSTEAWTLQKEWYPALLKENSDGEFPVLKEFIKTLNGMGIWKKGISIVDTEE